MKEVPKEIVPGGPLVPPDGIAVFEIGIGWAWRPDDGIVRLRLRVKHDTSLEDAKEVVETSWVLGERKPVRLITDIGTANGGSTAAREYYAGERGTAVFIAVAHMVTSPVARVLMTSWMRLQRPSYPTRVFPPECLDDAIAFVNSVNGGERAT